MQTAVFFCCLMIRNSALTCLRAHTASAAVLGELLIHLAFLCGLPLAALQRQVLTTAAKAARAAVAKISSSVWELVA